MIERLKKSSEYFIYVCGVLLLASVLLISTDVVLRKFFLISFGATDELSGYVLGICISWSLAYVLFEKMHIRIDIIYNKISEASQRISDVIAMGFTLAFIGLLVYFSASVFYTSFIKGSLANTPLGTPLWIPQLLWFSGYLFFLIVVVILFYKSIKAMVSKTRDEYTSVGKEEF